MTCARPTLSSNTTGLAIAEEECLKILPGVGGADAIWYEQEPNSYPGFGGENTTEQRSPINDSRQNSKGGIVSKSAKAGFESDFTKSNLVRLMQGYLYADAHTRGGTQDLIRLDPAKPVVTMASVAAASKKYTLSANVTQILQGSLVFGAGFAQVANNGLHVVASVSGKDVTVAEALQDETTVTASLVRVGHRFAAADIDVVKTGNIVSLQSTAFDFTTLGLIVGEWIGLGSDVAANRFANNVGYARISAIAAHLLTFDLVTWKPQAELGTGKTIEIYFGTVIRNEPSSSNIVRRTYCSRRKLGMGANGVQAEYITGCVPDKLTLSMKTASKMTYQATFIGCESKYVSGDAGDTLWPGTEVSALGEGLLNTSSDLYASRLLVVDPTTSTPDPLFGYAQSLELTIDNGVSEIPALGVLGSLDANEGNIGVTANIDAYFTSVAACRAIERNADLATFAIVAANNSAQIIDIPLIGAGASELKVEANKPIGIPVKSTGAKSKFGYTVLYANFPYVPDAISS